LTISTRYGSRIKFDFHFRINDTLSMEVQVQVINLENRISQLEDQKWECVLAGAESNPELQAKMNVIDGKLDKLYIWFAKAYANNLLTSETQLNSSMEPRRKNA
jgi:hypothetical protein